MIEMDHRLAEIVAREMAAFAQQMVEQAGAVTARIAVADAKESEAAASREAALEARLAEAEKERDSIRVQFQHATGNVNGSWFDMKMRAESAERLLAMTREPIAKFIEKVESGRAQSRDSYAAFKEVLAASDATALAWEQSKEKKWKARHQPMLDGGLTGPEPPPPLSDLVARETLQRSVLALRKALDNLVRDTQVEASTWDGDGLDSANLIPIEKWVCWKSLKAGAAVLTDTAAAGAAAEARVIERYRREHGLE